ncbi:MAG: DUF2062 domain-containing protein [Bacteroidota bacterium]
MKQGTSPHKLAISISIGFVLGLFPLLGVTTFIGFLISFVFKLNAAAIQLVNYLMYPLQIALIIPFIKIGGWMFSAKPTNYTITQLIEFVKSDFFGAISELWEIYILGIFAWGILVTPCGFLLFFISKYILLRFDNISEKEPEATAIDLEDL